MTITHGWTTVEPDDPAKDVSQRNLNDHTGNGLGWVNVQDYGAVGDGTTDDTAAISDAIDTLDAVGVGTLYFPAGTYVTTGGFTITADCLIIGEGSISGPVDSPPAPGISVVECDSATAVLFTLEGDVNRVERIGLRCTATPATAGGGIVVDGPAIFSRTDFEGIAVDNFFVGIDYRNGSAWSMNACQVNDPYSLGLRIRNLIHEDEGDWAISNTWIRSGLAEGTAEAGIRIEGAGGGKMTNVRVNGLGLHGFVTGLDFFVPEGVGAGEYYVGQSMFVNVSGDGIRAEYETDANDGSRLTNLSIINSMCGLFGNTAGAAIRLVGPTSDLAERIRNVRILGNFLLGEGDTAIVLSDCNTVRIGANQNDGFGAMFDAGNTLNLEDGTGGIGGEVLIGGTSGSGYLAVGSATTAAMWVYPSWLARATYHDTIRRASGLVGYWRLGEPSGTTANDSGPNNLDGTYGNTPTLGVTGALSGDADTAATFASASDEYVNVGTHDELTMDTAVSVECWFKGTTNDGQFFVRVYGDTALPANEELIGYRFGLNADKPALVCSDGVDTIQVSGATTVTDGAWHHIVGTRHGARARVYVDGAVDYESEEIMGEVGSMAASRLAVIAAWPFYGTFDARVGQLDGSLDEVAVYDRELSPAEVLLHYQIGINA